ncbi:response regulator [Microbacterium sp. ASV81]|uniref:Transcriptional regulatory protein n=1 Tax=Microbacterium capsulatum TaxID=3041921 RepID=A0ABU0XBF6_9MICO|nr:response regulator [Microbacterium sp. ASV81]MDQ4212444.1 response regulator [Microbacterium sp. ASV81]
MRQYTAVVVDDEMTVADLNRERVQAHPGFTVVSVAHNGATALRAISELRPDLVLLDVYLPDLNGLDVLRRLRALGNDVEVIAVTAARDMETVRRARLLGIRHYLVKPFTGALLTQRLDDVHRALSVPGREADLDQQAVDSMLGGSVRPDVAPKGLSAVSLRRVTALLDAADPDVSAAEVAETLGMSRVSARRYLEHLVAIGHAEVAPRYGSTGRPENGFRAVADER